MASFYHHWGEHHFDVLTYDHARQLDVPGIYIFAQETGAFSWYAHYIGQASSVKERFASHHKADAAIRRGATHVHFRLVRSAADRDFIERQLIQRFQPPLNEMLKGSLGGLLGAITSEATPAQSAGALSAWANGVRQPQQSAGALGGLLGAAMAGIAPAQPQGTLSAWAAALSQPQPSAYTKGLAAGGLLGAAMQPAPEPSPSSVLNRVLFPAPRK